MNFKEVKKRAVAFGSSSLIGIIAKNYFIFIINEANAPQLANTNTRRTLPPGIARAIASNVTPITMCKICFIIITSIIGAVWFEG